MKGRKVSLKLPSIIITIVCVGILAGILYLKSVGISNGWLETIVYPLIEMLCSISITAAIGTYLIEWKGFIEYVQQKLSELLSKPAMIRNLDSAYQSELLSQLIYERTAVDSQSFNKFMDEFYNELKKQSEVFGYYLLEQSNRVKCVAYQNGGIAVRDPSGMKYRELMHTRTITYGLLTQNAAAISEILTVNVTDERLFDGQETVQVNFVKINSRRLDRTAYSVICSHNHDIKNIDTLYKKRYVCLLRHPIKITEGLKIEVSYNTYEPMADFSYCTRMKQFCRRFKMDFSYDESSCNVYAQAFTFGERKNQNIEDGTISFDIDNWLMPGEGTNIYIGGK